MRPPLIRSTNFFRTTVITSAIQIFDPPYFLNMRRVYHSKNMFVKRDFLFFFQIAKMFFITNNPLSRPVLWAPGNNTGA